MTELTVQQIRDWARRNATREQEAFDKILQVLQERALIGINSHDYHALSLELRGRRVARGVYGALIAAIDNGELPE